NAELADNDSIPVSQVGEGETKRIKISELDARYTTPLEDYIESNDNELVSIGEELSALDNRADSAADRLDALEFLMGGVQSNISLLLLSVIPTGTCLPFPSDDIPDGFFECDGSAKLRIGYPALFAVIGTSHGEGDGSTTFN